MKALDAVWFGAADTSGPTPPIFGPTRSGPVVADDRSYRDDQGRFRPLGITLFPLIHGMEHEPDRYEKNISDAAANGVQAARILGEVGCRSLSDPSTCSWADRVIDPILNPNYERYLAAAIDALWKYGLRTILTIFGGGAVGTQSEVDQTIEQVIRVVSTRLERVQEIEIANEDNFPGSNNDMLRCARRLRQALPSIVLVPFCAPNGSLEQGDVFITPDGCNSQNVHPERQPGDKDWRQGRQLWDHPQYHYPYSALEPMGVELHQLEDLNDPVRLAICWAVGMLRGFNTWVLHCGPGVRMGGSWDVTKYGRASNYWEIGDTLWPCAVMLRYVESILPPDLCYWVKTSQHGPGPDGGGPFADNFLWADWIWSDFPGDHAGVSRSFLAYDGGRFCCITFGVQHEANLIAEANVSGTLYDLRARTSSEVSVPAGGRVHLAGNANADMAYIFVGTRS